MAGDQELGRTTEQTPNTRTPQRQEEAAAVSSPTVTTAAVSIRPPTFAPNRLSAYFRIIEAQFSAAGITTNSTKARHLVANLPIEVVEKLSDSILENNDYDTLKKI